MPTENLLTPELLRRVAWTPPAAADRGASVAIELPSGARALGGGRLSRPHS